MILHDKIEQIKEANDIVDVIGDYVALKKSGSNFKALCPFHQEKTPSFIVSPQKQIFHCFGCNVGGNVFTFLQKFENITFIESVRLLAKKAGISIEEYKVDFKSSEKERILEINKEALKYFREQFFKNEKSLQYVKLRGITEEAVEEFKIGYAPDGNKLYYRLREKNFRDDLILKSCLCQKKNFDYCDFFRDRLIFPIFNIFSEPIAFGGRVFDNSLPKYINSAETPLYHKGKTLYNLNNAKKYKDEFFVIVEGYMDAIRLFSEGIKNVVATLGTALTEEQIKILKRHVSKVVILYDMDEAGRASAIRAGEIGFKSGLEVLIVHYPGAKDPDEFIKTKGIDAMKKAIKESVPFINYKIDFYRQKNDLKNDYNKEKVLDEMANLLISVDNLVVKSASIRKISQLLSVNETIVEEYVNNKKKQICKKNGEIKETIELSPRKRAIDLAEKSILMCALASLGTKKQDTILKHIFNSIKLYNIDYLKFNNLIYGELLAKIEEFFSNKESNILNKLQITYIENDTVINLISELLAEEAKEPFIKDVDRVSKIIQIVDDCIQKIEEAKINEEAMALQARIEEAERVGDYEAVNNFIKEKQRLMKIIKKRGDDIE